MFLAANQDAIATAAQMGIAQADSASVDFSPAGIRSTSRAFSRKSAAYRRRLVEEGRPSDPHATPDPDLVSSIQEILEEEMGKDQSSK